MQRNGGGSRVEEMETLLPPSADGGRSHSKSCACPACRFKRTLDLRILSADRRSGGGLCSCCQIRMRMARCLMLRFLNHGFSAAGFACNPLIVAGTQNHRRQKNWRQKNESNEQSHAAIHFSAIHIFVVPASAFAESKTLRHCHLKSCPLKSVTSAQRSAVKLQNSERTKCIARANIAVNRSCG